MTLLLVAGTFFAALTLVLLAAFFITGGKVNAPNGAQELQKAV